MKREWTVTGQGTTEPPVSGVGGLHGSLSIDVVAMLFCQSYTYSLLRRLHLPVQDGNCLIASMLQPIFPRLLAKMTFERDAY